MTDNITTLIAVLDDLLAALAERDRYRAAIEAVAATPNEFEWDVPPTAAHILRRALNENGDE